MNGRDVPPLLREGADLPDLLREALESAASDELPGRARMSRIEDKLAAAMVREREEEALAPNPRISGWRPSPPRRRIRFAAAKIGLSALVGMGAAWASVEAYRVYQESSERAAWKQLVEAAPEGAAKSSARVHAPSPPERTAVEPAPELREEPEPAPAPPTATRPEASPKSTAKPASVPRSEPPPAPSIAQPAPAPAPLEEDLLELATQALRRNPGLALALADKHARAFARGRLAQEREVVAIEALSKLGRSDAATARARRFLEQYPHSPYANDVLRMTISEKAR